MGVPLARRQFLTRTAVTAATGSLLGVAAPAPAADAAATTSPTTAVLRWDAARRRWPVRPPAPPSERAIFSSTEDPSAPRPPGFDLRGGDVWWRHPDAEQRIAPLPEPEPSR